MCLAKATGRMRTKPLHMECGGITQGFQEPKLSQRGKTLWLFLSGAGKLVGFVSHCGARGLNVSVEMASASMPMRTFMRDTDRIVGSRIITLRRENKLTPSIAASWARFMPLLACNRSSWLRSWISSPKSFISLYLVRSW